MTQTTRSRKTRSHGQMEKESECEGTIPFTQPDQKRLRISGDNDLQNRTCGICNRIFTKAVHKRNHMSIHDPNREKYTCPQPNCDKQYNDVKNWRVHFNKNHTRGPETAKQQQLARAEFELKLAPANPAIQTIPQRMEELELENRKLRLQVLNEKI